MLDILIDDIKYEKCVTESKTNTPSLLAPVVIKGLRVRGNIKVTHSDNGDSTTCTIVYRTAEKIPAHSKLNGHEVMESVKINAFGRNVGYLNYVK